MNFVLRVIGIFIAVAVAVWLVPGIEVGGTVSTWASVLIIALIIALLNMTIKPILQLFGLPITVITPVSYTHLVGPFDLDLVGLREGSERFLHRQRKKKAQRWKSVDVYKRQNMHHIESVNARFWIHPPLFHQRPAMVGASRSAMPQYQE